MNSVAFKDYLLAAIPCVSDSYFDITASRNLGTVDEQRERN